MTGWRKRQINLNREEYSEEWDAFYNVERNEWLESKCDDPTCEYCINRPERPLNEDYKD
jgi:hypothetical protein